MILLESWNIRGSWLHCSRILSFTKWIKNSNCTWIYLVSKCITRLFKLSMYNLHSSQAERSILIRIHHIWKPKLKVVKNERPASNKDWQINQYPIRSFLEMIKLISLKLFERDKKILKGGLLYTKAKIDFNLFPNVLVLTKKEQLNKWKRNSIYKTSSNSMLK